MRYGKQLYIRESSIVEQKRTLRSSGKSTNLQMCWSFPFVPSCTPPQSSLPCSVLQEVVLYRQPPKDSSYPSALIMFEQSFQPEVTGWEEKAVRVHIHPAPAPLMQLVVSAGVIPPKATIPKQLLAVLPSCPFKPAERCNSHYC